MFVWDTASVSDRDTAAAMTKHDLVIYGASGFTGQFVIEYVHRAAVEHQVGGAGRGRAAADGVSAGVLGRGGAG